jgi:hypothetical protein
MNGAPKTGPLAFAGRYARSIYQILSNRRKFERVPISGTVHATCHGIVMDTTHVCTCVDISRSGIGIDCPVELAAGTFVSLHEEEQGPRRIARVCYCRQQGETYRIGLQFESSQQS